jgi:hypothetical protein
MPIAHDAIARIHLFPFSGDNNIVLKDIFVKGIFGKGLVISAIRARILFRITFGNSTLCAAIQLFQGIYTLDQRIQRGLLAVVLFL